jgi:hypothetical protein
MLKFGFRRPAPAAPPVAPPAAAQDPVSNFLTGLKARGAAIYEPYRKSDLDWRYNLYFCEHLAMFEGSRRVAAGQPWEALFAPACDTAALARIVDDASIQPPLRLLAARRLRGRADWAGDSSPLVIVMEVPMPDSLKPGGLDTMLLSANSVSYVNHRGSATLVDGRDMAECRMAGNLMSAAADLILAGAAKPRHGPRMPPPDRVPLVRITILTPAADYILEGEEKDLYGRYPQVFTILDVGGMIIKMMLARRREQDAAIVH